MHDTHASNSRGIHPFDSAVLNARLGNGFGIDRPGGGLIADVSDLTDTSIATPHRVNSAKLSHKELILLPNYCDAWVPLGVFEPGQRAERPFEKGDPYSRWVAAEMRAVGGLPGAVLTDIDSTIALTEGLHDFGHCAAMQILRTDGKGGLLNKLPSEDDWHHFRHVTKHKGDVEAGHNAANLGVERGLWSPGTTGDIYRAVKTAAMIRAIDTQDRVVGLEKYPELVDLMHAMVSPGDYKLLPVPGMVEILTMVHDRSADRAKIHGERKVPIIACTGGASATAEAILSALRTPDGRSVRDLFDSIVASEDVAKGKPAPDSFLEGHRRAHVIYGDSRNASHISVWAFEDRPTGAKSALESFGDRGLGTESIIFIGNVEDPNKDLRTLRSLAAESDFRVRRRPGPGELQPVVFVSTEQSGLGFTPVLEILNDIHGKRST